VKDDMELPAGLRAEYERSTAGTAPPPRPACPSLPRIAEAAGTGVWRTDELQHLPGCPFCQRILAAEFRMDCPGMAVLAGYRAGISPFAAALATHLEEDGCERCARRLESAWIAGVAALIGAGSLTAGALGELARGVAEATLHLAAEPAFLPAGDSGAIQQVHAAGPDGLLALTLRQEGPRVAAYVETPDPTLAGRAVSVEVLGRRGRIRTRLVLGLVEGVGAFGCGDLGLLTDFLSGVGPDCDVVAALER
jgi:hypothetical protein